MRDHSRHPIPFHDQIHHVLLEEGEAGLILNKFPDSRPVQRAIGLSPGGPHRGALTRVQGAKLNAGSISGQGHHAAQGIDFPHQVGFSDAADGRVAGHLANGFDALRQQQGVRPEASRRQGRFRPCMAATDDDHVIAFLEVHLPALRGLGRGSIKKALRSP